VDNLLDDLGDVTGGGVVAVSGSGGSSITKETKKKSVSSKNLNLPNNENESGSEEVRITTV
jgi:hypothetical protein